LDQIDWGKKYEKLNTYFKQIGFHHRLIYPYIHEENDTIEYLHRHIIEIDITFLGQCHTPLKYKGYAFETLVHLINRMSTSILNGKSLFE